MNKRPGMKENEEVKDDVVSKTQIKNDAKAKRNFAKELIVLSESKLNALPLLDSTKAAINDYHKQSGNIARKRHLAYIGKCLRNDDAEAAKIMLVEENFSQFRDSVQPNKKKEELSGLIEALVERGDDKIQQLVEDNPALDRQLLRQLVRNVKNAKTATKKSAATNKLMTYFKANPVND